MMKSIFLATLGSCALFSSEVKVRAENWSYEVSIIPSDNQHRTYDFVLVEDVGVIEATGMASRKEMKISTVSGVPTGESEIIFLASEEFRSALQRSGIGAESLQVELRVAYSGDNGIRSYAKLNANEVVRAFKDEATDGDRWVIVFRYIAFDMALKSGLMASQYKKYIKTGDWWESFGAMHRWHYGIYLASDGRPFSLFSDTGDHLRLRWRPGAQRVY